MYTSELTREAKLPIQRGKHPQEYVLQYLPAEMEEIFRPHERLWLAEGKIVERDIRGGKATYIDMGVAARRIQGNLQVKTAILATAVIMFAAPAFSAEETPKLGTECRKVLETITKAEIVKKGRSQSQADLVWRDAFGENPVATLIAANLTPHDFMRSYFDALEFSKSDAACNGKQAALDFYREGAIKWLPKLASGYVMTLGMMDAGMPKVEGGTKEQSK